MAVAFKELAMSGFRPKGDLIYFGVADEEAGGTHGAEWIVDHHWDAVKCDYMVTELGGFWAGDGRSVLITTAEKGIEWRRLTIAGTPSHGSMPYGTDNAVVTAAEVIRRISSHVGTARTGALWDALLRTSNLPADVLAMLADPARLDDALAQLPPMVARRFHACSHTTMSCNVVHGGQKTNIVPDSVLLDVDVRTMPGVDGDDVDELLLEILGELAPRVTISRLQPNGMATESSTIVGVARWSSQLDVPAGRAHSFADGWRHRWPVLSREGHRCLRCRPVQPQRGPCGHRQPIPRQ
jgi:acetylornithine deacetylase/succinyl-diaminopimelate desuccinylase-like protein